MEDNNINANQKIMVKASELISKFKHPEDRINFCKEHNFYFPKESYYDSTFFLQWLSGNKKLIPLGKHGDYNMPYFRNGGVLTKKFVASIIKGKPKYKDYIPDNAKLENLSKSFLFSLIAFIEPNIYSSLYELYKQKSAENIYHKWDDYAIDVKTDIANSIKNFVPVKSHINNLKPFRLTKNNEDTGVFVDLNGRRENMERGGEGDMDD